MSYHPIWWKLDLRSKILIIIKITPFTLASKFVQLYSAEWYICLCIQGPICCSYNRHCPFVLSVFKPPFYTVLGYMYVSTGSTTVLLLSNIITSGFVLFHDTTSLSVKCFFFTQYSLYMYNFTWGWNDVCYILYSVI